MILCRVSVFFCFQVLQGVIVNNLSSALLLLPTLPSLVYIIKNRSEREEGGGQGARHYISYSPGQVVKEKEKKAKPKEENKASHCCRRRFFVVLYAQTERNSCSPTLLLFRHQPVNRLGKSKVKGKKRKKKNEHEPVGLVLLGWRVDIDSSDGISASSSWRDHCQ